MSNVLDTILIKELVIGPVVVNSDFETDYVDISFKEGEFSIQLSYESGIDVNMEIILQLSNDAENFADIIDSTQIITDPSGSHIIDVLLTGTNYARVKINVNSGSITLKDCVYKGKRRH